MNTWCAAGRDGGNKLHAVQLDVENEMNELTTILRDFNTGKPVSQLKHSTRVGS